MKKIVIILLVLAGVGFAAVKFNLIPNLIPGTKQEAKDKVFLCPMHPTYTSDRQGDCPICGMKLVEKKMKNKPKSKTKEIEKVLYTCPMHPQIIKDSEGTCPICGMKLVKKKMKKESGMKGHNMKMPMGQSSEEFKLEIDPAKQQYIGIKTKKAERKNVSKEIKLLGTVEPDETKIYHIHTKFSGYIEKVYADYEGKLVEKGQPLFTVYSPALVSTQEEFLLALEAQEKLKGNRFPEIDKSQESLLMAARRRLELWDITDEQVDKLQQTKKVTKELTIYSPVSGFITKRNAFEGHEITPDEAIYDIADLSSVWILLETFEMDIPFIMLGQNVKIRFPYDNLKSFNGKVTYIYPTVDPMTRTTQIRVEVDNPGYKLKPGMYIDAIVFSSVGNHIVVPTQAIIETGERQVIFIKDREGKFSPREIEAGPEVNNERVVYSGLSEGEDIVVSGNFLLDSESNLQTALDQFSGHQH